MRLLALFAAMCVFLSAQRGGGQVIDLSGGASSAYGAQGGSIGFHGRTTDFAAGIGMMNGHLSGGASLQRTVRGGVTILGQQELNIDLPTDVFNVSHTLAGVGLGMKREAGSSSLAAFMGVASTETGTPLFRSAKTGKQVNFAQWKTSINPGCTATVTALKAAKMFGVGSVQCVHSRALTYALSLGYSGGLPYFAGSTLLKTKKLDLKTEYVFMQDGFQRGSNPMQMTMEPVRENIAGQYRPNRMLSFGFAHGNYVSSGPPSQDAANQHSELDSAGVEVQHGQVSVNLTGLHSSFRSSQASGAPSAGENKAVSAVLRYGKGRVQWSETLLHSANSTSSNTTIVSSAVAVDLTSRLRVSEGVNLTAQGATFSHGGTLLTRFSSFAVDYQFFYVASRPDKPFQQSLIFHAETPLPKGVFLQASNTLSPTGATLYTFQVGRSFYVKSARTKSVASDVGENTVRGRVEDMNGNGIGRAALMVGKERVYTDSDGYFTYRERRANAHPFQVLTGEFVSSDDYAVVSAPAEIRTGSDLPVLHIIVKKQSVEATA